MTRQVALITGTSSGFGRLLVEQLAARDTIVYATMRGIESHREVVDQFTALGSHVRLEELDVTSPADVSRVAERVERESGRLDVLVNNAGSLVGGITEALTVEQLSSQLDTNVLGPFRLMRALLPLMRRQRTGLVINVTSIAGRMVFPFFGAYCASKWALDALSESMRYELASQGVDVAIVEPGFFHTQLFAHATSSADVARANEYGATALIPGQLLAAFDQLFAQQAAETAPQVLVDAIVALIDAEPGSRPLRTCVGVDMGVRALNDATKDVGPNTLAALGLRHLQDVRAAAATA
ncbi:MAG TPA: SDR family oxidoreductase [Vicinamibacterales bacterium]|nr:SDR family oxidoreductase [Vicinamibacterales bacterium]